MAEAQGAIVIRDDAGTEHEFPPGFDPERAAAIVRQQTAPPERPAARGWQPAGTHEISDSPETTSALADLLGPLAHPQTLTDFARLLTLPVDAVKRAAASALTLAAAKNAAGAVSQLPAAAVRGAVNVTAGAGDVVHPDVIGIVSPRAGKVVQIAQKLRDARTVASAAAPAIADAPAAVETATAVEPVAASQASQTAAPAADAVVKASGKMQLTAPEFQEFQRLIKGGMSLPDAEHAVKMARDLARLPEDAAAAVGPGAAPPVAPAPPVEPVPPPSAPAPTAGLRPTPESAAIAASLPDQRALNEAALAARRAAYQASQQPGATAVIPASGKLHFTAPEWAAFRELRARGASLEDAAAGAQAAGQFARRFGLSQPTVAQAQFPKR